MRKLVALVALLIGIAVLTPRAGMAQGGATTMQEQEPGAEDCFWFCSMVINQYTHEQIGAQCNNYGSPPAQPAWNVGYLCVAMGMGCYVYRGPFCDGMTAFTFMASDGTVLAMLDGCKYSAGRARLGHGGGAQNASGTSSASGMILERGIGGLGA